MRCANIAVLAANIKMSANFAISDGWNSTKPRFSQRTAPPLFGANFVPLKTSTIKSKRMETAKTGRFSLCSW